ncbi:hypothetical protein M430DRAFT_177497 [Amorphotheca resinae ATCC 22711]|uniref:Fork-head domain-containing protein n=1 Tax=Amorphotheca resinae ATCC 22711 TaxID=857342 RepID=A0A2T3AT41_AMORE|nr:hypothetical protein M430DRAFT_177497 [Amorphotheca resinae ATCC 22711]PSS10658.1 hypothetical protein M430DRAFT_177497 [Amorphotheca resinae ATCC 22711]
MSSTRYTQQPLQIYQDSSASYDHAPMPPIPSPIRPKKPSPLRPIKNASSRRNIVLNPPQQGYSPQSPLKSSQQTSSSPSRAPFNSRLNVISMPPPGRPMHQTDSMEKKQPLMSKFKPQKALFTTFASTKSTDKENYPIYEQHTTSYRNGFDESNFSLEGLYGQKRAAKRTLLEAPSIHESRASKRSKTEERQGGEAVEEQVELPAPDSFPPLHDDGTKPPHSYAQLIGMSILRAPARRLTLAQIYKWISDTYSFYSPSDAGWQNSIRHNLSLNKAFIKQERPKDDPGKGNYWAIQQGMEHQFIKEKPARKSVGPNENVSLLSTNLAPVTQPESSQSSFKPLTPAVQDLPPQSAYTMPEAPSRAHPELSSDATIPASDAFNPEADAGEEARELPPSSPLIRSSPPAAMMHSSPPMPHVMPRMNATPPPVPRFPSSDRTRSHKRKFASMDDSGYFSSLDSSAMRPHQANRLLTSEADRPRIKRGRAEEEIARLRGSSYDSPTKGRTATSSFAPPSSSPLRRNQKHNGPSNMLPPLTPAVKLQPPVRPAPPSVSPNTNLRLHRDRVRELVGSPVRGMGILDSNLPPWSPAFCLDDSPFIYGDLNNDFDIFADNNSGFLSVPGNGSPEKRSAKRPRLDRSRSANSVADNSNYNKSNTSTPLVKVTPNLAPSALDSPVKGLGFMASPSNLLSLKSPIKLGSPPFSVSAFGLPQDEEFYGSEFLSEEATDFSGMDIMQGFQKIGAGGQSSRDTPKTNNSRPSFGRNFTSQF